MEEQTTPVVKVGKKLQKRHGSFWISKKAVDLLLRHSNSSALHIYTYLAIARHADASGMFSTLGNSGITRKLGLNNEQYLRVTNYLKRLSSEGLQLIYTKDEWQSYAFPINEEIECNNQSNINNPNYVPEKYLNTPPTNKGAGRKGYVRWVLPSFSCGRNERIWFHNDLIEDVNSRKALKELLRLNNKDVIARILLMLYNHNDILFGGVRPYQNVYIKYDMQKIGNKNGVDIYRAKASELCQSDHFRTITKNVFKDIQVDYEMIKLAMDKLEDLKLIYKSIVALDSSPDNKDTMVLYDMDIKVHNGIMLKEKRSCHAGIIDDAIKAAGYESARRDNRFYDEYSAVAAEGVCPYVVGIFRLKHDVTNPKNGPVKESRAGRKEHKAMLYEWLAKITEELDYGIIDYSNNMVSTDITEDRG